MITYTDAPFTVTVKGGLDLTTISQPHITLKQGYDTVVDITDVTILSSTALSFKLTQAQTARFKDGEAEMRLTVFNGTGDRIATKKTTVLIEDNTLKRVIDYDGV